MEPTLIQASIGTQIAVSLESPPLCVVVKREPGGPPLAREPVFRADLLDALSETWRDGCLRQGHATVPLADVTFRLLLHLKSPSSNRCLGYTLELTRPDGSPCSREFSLKSLKAVALRAAQRFTDTGAPEPSQAVYYEVHYASALAPSVVGVAAPLPREGTMKTQRLTCLNAPLRPLIEAATPVSEIDEEAFAVFYTKEAFAKAERFARQGARAHPPIETGAVLVGWLCTCPDSGEFFVVVADAWEVQDAEQTEFSLAYTGKSWMRIQTVLRARQAATPGCGPQLVGQTHGHNYLPNGGQTCEACFKLPICNLSNLFVSPDDQKWSRAVFAKQPWSLCAIFGLTARGDHVQKLFTLKDMQLQPRGFFLLEDFNPEQWTRNLRPT